MKLMVESMDLGPLGPLVKDTFYQNFHHVEKKEKMLFCCCFVSVFSKVAEKSIHLAHSDVLLLYRPSIVSIFKHLVDIILL